MICCSIGKVLALAVRAIFFNVQLQIKKVETNAHYCTVNHTCFSGSMEVNVALDLTTDVHVNSKGKVFIEALVSDNVSIMKMLLTHKKTIQRVS